MPATPLNEASKAAMILNVYREELPRVQESALRAAGWRIVADVQRDFTSRGIGREIWGGDRGVFVKNAKSKRGWKYVNKLNKLVYLEKAKKGQALGADSRTFDAWFRVRGIPALVVTGGKAKPHVIESKAAHYRGLASKYAGKRRGEKFAARARQEAGRRALRFAGPGGEVFAYRVNHPGGRFDRWNLVSEHSRKLPTYYRPAFERRDLALRRKLRLV